MMVLLKGQYMFRKNIVIIVIATAITASLANAQTVPDYATVAGGYTAIPLMIKAGEKFVSKSPEFKPPKILYNNSSIGFKLFCAGVGAETPNINTATRRIRAAEWELCHHNGVNEIIEFEIGRDAIVLSQAVGGKLSEISSKDFFLGIAKEVPDPKDPEKHIPNPYKNWKEINPNLPDSKIQVLAPDPVIGLYETYINGLVIAIPI